MLKYNIKSLINEKANQEKKAFPREPIKSLQAKIRRELAHKLGIGTAGVSNLATLPRSSKRFISEKTYALICAYFQIPESKLRNYDLNDLNKDNDENSEQDPF